jgi:phage terminase small subunit
MIIEIYKKTCKMLTPKQEIFCIKYIEFGNASKAYRFSYEAKRMSDNAIYVEASRLLKHPKIALRLSSLRTEHRNRHNDKFDSIVAHYDYIKNTAPKTGQINQALNALEKKGVMFGLYEKY